MLISDKQQELKDLESWRKKLKSALSGKGKELPKNPKNFPKAVEACDGRIKKLQEQISSKECEKKNKQDNAEVALGTSKINYMDPRITISWCKRKEVPIERVFPKALRGKFAWAMDNEPEWRF